MTPERPDYGLDAPGVVRNLALSGGACLLVALAVWLGWLPRVASFGGVRVAVLPTMIPPGLSLGAAAVWMYHASKYGKLAERDRLLDRIEWKGDERVLDIGCGRGLILVGAAKRLTTGRAIGVDLWQARDLSGNRADVPLKNAALEGVAAKVAIQTADMRRLPFKSSSIDLVVSRAVIHNLYSAADRAMTIREIARVLRPGGRALISDIRHHQEYTRIFLESGCADVRLLDSRLVSALITAFTMGSLRPNTTLARKSGSGSR